MPTRSRSLFILGIASFASPAHPLAWRPAPVPPTEAQSTVPQVAAQSYRNGETQLQTLIDEDRLRPATQADIDHLLAIWRRLRPKSRPEPITWERGLHRTFVVLKPISIPAGMYGARSAHFLLAPGVAYPSDKASHNTYISLATGACTKAAGRSCASDFPWLVKSLLGVTVRHCREGHRDPWRASPFPSGPLRLIEVNCLPFGAADGQPDHLSVSPDAQMVAGLSDNRPAEALIVNVTSGSLTKAANPSTVSDIVGSGVERPPFVWSSNSRSLWSWTQDRLVPGGWTAAGGRTMRIAGSGVTSDLPPLASPAGPLDDLQWVGSEGKAIAFFGIKGSYYRPEHDDPAPEMAMVNGDTGSTLDRLPFSRLSALKPHTPDAAAHVVRRMTVVVLPDGGIRAVVRAGALIVWTQGRPPVVIADPYPQERDNPIRLLPGGRMLLVMRTIQPIGLQCFDCEYRKVPAPTPREGPLLELRDLVTGKIRWTLRVRADNFWSAPIFSVSDDGRYALVSLPPLKQATLMGVVRLKDGSVLQKIPVGFQGSYDPEAGFADRGRKVWLRVGSTLETFQVSFR